LVRLLAFFGASSYSIYLWHAFAYRAAEHLTAQLGWSPRSPLTFLVYVAASLGGGVLMARLVELPVLALRDRLLPATDVRPGGQDEQDLVRGLR
jgi:peptidoglycan/LPS O-acetylase OafA/YrhL